MNAMRLRVRPGPGWTWTALALIFLPIAAFAVWQAPLPAAEQSGWTAAAAFAGIPVLIAAMAVREVRGRRELRLSGARLEMVRVRDSRVLAAIDLGRPHRRLVRLREGRWGKTGGILSRWIQVVFEQDGSRLCLETPELQHLVPVGPPWSAVEPPRAAAGLVPWLDLSELDSASAPSLVGDEPPYGKPGSHRWIELPEDGGTLAAVLAGHADTCVGPPESNLPR